MTITLLPGTEVMMRGERHRITHVNLTDQVVTLDDEHGTPLLVSLSRLAAARPVDRVEPLVGGPLLNRNQRRAVARRIAHALEADTGYTSGDPERPREGEPREGYDPAHTTVKERRATKARELRAAGIPMSESTLFRIARDLRNGDAFAGVDKRWFPTLTPADAEKSAERDEQQAALERACIKVHEQFKTASTHTLSFRWNTIRAELKREPSWKCALPSDSTLDRWHRARFTKGELVGSAKQRSSKTPPPSGERHLIRAERIGQLVYVDAWPVDALLQGTGMEGWVTGHVIVFMDALTHSICALRVVDGSARGLDVMRCYLALFKPKAMGENWGPEARWPYAGVPESVVVGASAMPFLTPEAVTSDHGSENVNHQLTALLRATGVHVKPARRRRGSDKAIVEQSFDTAKKGLVQFLAEYRGANSVERGADIEGRARMTSGQLEELLHYWVAAVWQHHLLRGVTPPWTTEGEWTPARLYQAALCQSGLVMRAITLDEQMAMLEPRKLHITDKGITVSKLIYDDSVLDAYRNKPDPRAPLPRNGGRRVGTWTIRVSGDDLRSVFWQHPDGEWHEIGLGGRKPDDVPFFGKADLPEIQAAVTSLPPALTKEEQYERTVEVIAHVLESEPTSALERARASRRKRNASEAKTPAASPRAAVRKSLEGRVAEAMTRRESGTRPTEPSPFEAFTAVPKESDQ